MLLSTAYIPCIEYIAYIAQSTLIRIEAHEHYAKQTYRNRTCIASAQGLMELIIPVIQPNGSKTCIRDVRISYAEAWQKKHWHAITSAYNSSPFFEYYQDVFHTFYTKQYTFLYDYNKEILLTLLKACNITTEIKDSASFTPLSNNTYDVRYTLSPKITSNIHIPEYTQVFAEKYPFLSQVSILDTLCNIGPDTGLYCKKITLK